MEAFLTRVVPMTGNYLTITWKSPDRGWVVRSYAPSQIDQATSMARWAAKRRADVYFAVASFNIAELAASQKGISYTHAKREQANVHLIRTLVVDADCKRPGDGKDPAHVFADRNSAVAWLVAFTRKTGIPMPNLAVNSGYGLHWYWTFEDPVTLAVWQPLAIALKDAMLAEGWVGDTAPTIDGARIMRLPTTMNFKAGVDTPAPVKVLSAYTQAHYANADLMSALTPWLGKTQARTGTYGGATISSIGPRPSFATQGGAGLNQSARSGIQSQFKFSEVAKKCEQVKKSLANGGLGDPYPVWYLGHTNLAVFTSDGKQFIHPISAGDPRYTHAQTEAAYARAESEVAQKGLGAPTCKHYDNARPGVCGTCPFNGKIVSPVTLGTEDSDMPLGYRQVTVDGQPRIERYASSKKADKSIWVPLVLGEVSDPRLDWVSSLGGHRISFTYKLAGGSHAVWAVGAEMNNQTQVAYFERQGVPVTRHNVVQFGDFCMAWISKLRMQHQTKTEVVRPFGWNFDRHGDRTGLAIAGTVYKLDGTEIMVPGGDPKIAAMYRPAGDIKHWRKAAALFEGRRPDLQALIACSFGAPLVSLCSDVRGMTLNFWSTGSGIGKSTAIKIGHSVWSDLKGVQSMNDTFNSVMRSLSEPRVYPRYWDELRIDADEQDGFAKLIFTIPQGKERARLQSDTTLREVGEWETLLIFTSNRSCQDYLLARDDGTDSGLTRLLEVELTKDIVPFDPLAGQLIKATENNYGHAGRIFAKYIATHLPLVRSRLASMLEALTTSLDAQRDERFAVAAMACILVGAGLAAKLGLFQFDMPGINACLTRAFQLQREQRARRSIVTSAGGYDLEEIIGEFVQSQADYRIRTTQFMTPGLAKVDVIDFPRGNVIRLQVAQNAGIVRIARNALFEWLHNKNRPADVIVKQILANIPGAVEHRKTLASGTGYTGSNLVCLDIPCHGRLADLIGTARPQVQKAPMDAVLDD